MANIFSILQSNYIAAGDNLTASRSRYVNVNPDDYQGKWTGKYPNGKAFEFLVSNVSGFRATVKYQSGSTINYQQVLIKDSSFRVGDTKFILAKSGVAQVRTAVTDAFTGSVSVTTAYAQQN